MRDVVIDINIKIKCWGAPTDNYETDLYSYTVSAVTVNLLVKCS